jgi:type III restriction enzyme
VSTNLKRFQQDAVNSATNLLLRYLDDLARVEHHTAKADHLRAHSSALLLEAPTGTGKTLISGHVAEALSARRVVWFWFAPFAGLVSQTESVIRDEFSRLRVRSIERDRHVEHVREGDVFVATWALLANPKAGIHQPAESAPTLPAFMEALRAKGYRIGVVVDEAHHTATAGGQAFKAYKDVIAPDLTILVTATPNDRDLERFQNNAGLRHIGRVTISRQQAVDQGLIKQGVRVGILHAQRHAQLINYRHTAVKVAVAHHRALKIVLQANDVLFTPLLLIQVDSGTGSIPEVEEWLRKLGFTEGQVRKHTADEPNEALILDAADDHVEVLLFKMAVATGFDAPRAFTLCSLRAVKDADFGVQLVGRILRVDRRLQGRQDLPDELNYGYVFLADADGQQGLRDAAGRINAIRDSYSNLTPSVTVMDGLDEAILTAIDQGMPVLLTLRPLEETGDDVAQGPPESNSGGQVTVAVQQGLWDYSKKKTDVKKYGAVAIMAMRPAHPDPEQHRYLLRTDVIYPRQLNRAVVALNSQGIMHDLVKNFPYDSVIDDSRRASTELTLRLLSLFDDRALDSQRLRGAFTPKEIAELAQQTLFGVKNGALDMAKAEEYLIAGLQREFERRGWPEAEDPDRVRTGWQQMIALNKGALERAVAATVTQFTEVQPAAPFPDTIESSLQLAASPKNIYGRYPNDLNRWERNFAELISDAPEVVWWHRNPERKAYAVSLPIVGYSPNGNNFFPDFAVGVAGRATRDQVLLVEVKGEINNSKGDSVEKAQATHPEYGSVLMVFWDKEEVWRVVRYNSALEKNELGEVFDPIDMADF